MIALKYATASQEILLGPFLDSTDGNTAETGLTLANTDILIWKNGATTLASKNSGGATHISGGYYYTTLDATDTNTLGPLEINVHVSGALAVRRECCVYPAVVYDAIIAGSDYLQVDAVQIEGSDATDQINAACDTAIADAALATASALATVDSNVDAILLDTGTDGVIVAINNDKTGYTVSTVSDKTGYSISGTLTTLDALDTAQDLQHAATQADIAALENISSSDVETAAGAALAAYDGPTNAEMEARTLPSADYLVEGDTLARVTLVDTCTTNTDMRGTDSAYTGTPPTVEETRAEIDSNSTQLAAIKAKTDNLPGGIAKNSALENFYFFMVLSSDHYTGATGKTITAQISKDGGAFASCTNSATELSGGVYVIDLTASEMNADIIQLLFTETDCDSRTYTIKTDE